MSLLDDLLYRFDAALDWPCDELDDEDQLGDASDPMGATAAAWGCAS